MVVDETHKDKNTLFPGQDSVDLKKKAMQDVKEIEGLLHDYGIDYEITGFPAGTKEPLFVPKELSLAFPSLPKMCYDKYEGYDKIKEYLDKRKEIEQRYGSK